MKDQWFKVWAAMAVAVSLGIYASDCNNRKRFVDDKFARAERWRKESRDAAACYRDDKDPCACMASMAPAHAVRCYERRGRAPR